MEYIVPEGDGAPDEAWHGHVRSETIEVEVREIPLKERFEKPTAEQLADIEVTMANENSEAKRGSFLRLENALLKTENEGLARHIVSILKKHQPIDENELYPVWWRSLHRLVQQRAVSGSGSMGILGPYMTDFALVSLKALEHAMAGKRLDGPPCAHHFLLAYVRRDGAEKDVIRDRLIAAARKNAKVPAAGKGNVEHKLAYFKLGVSWEILLNTGVLYDDMPMLEATNILGPPLRRRHRAVWQYRSPMHVNPYLHGAVSPGADGETVRLTPSK